MHQGKLKNMIKPLLRSHLLCIRWSLYFMHLKYQLLFPELFLILSQLYATLLTSTCQKNIKARLERCKFLHVLEFPPQSSACHYNHSYPLVLLTSCRNHKGSVLTDLFPVAGSYSPDSPAQGWLHPQWTHRSIQFLVQVPSSQVCLFVLLSKINYDIIQVFFFCEFQLVENLDPNNQGRQNLRNGTKG